MIAERITQLDGEPNFSPQGMLTRSHSEYVEGDSLADMIREDLIAERIAVQSYSEIIRYLGENDPTSRRMMEEILAKEEEHAEDMKTLLETIAKEEAQERQGRSKLTAISRKLLDCTLNVEGENKMNNDKNKCAHKSCNCPARRQEQSIAAFTYCEAAKDTTEIACGCEHAGCSGNLK